MNEDIARLQKKLGPGDRNKVNQYLDTVLAILKPGVVFLGGPPVQKGVLIIVLET